MKSNWANIGTGVSVAAAVLSTVLFLLIARHFPDLYRNLTDESTGVELATAIFYLLAGVMLLVATLRHRGNTVAKILPVLLALFFIFIAGEEESWGMWILGFEAPEAVANLNVQNEINVHNLGVFGGLLEPHRVLNMFILAFTIIVPILDSASAGARDLFRKLYLPISDVRLIPWFLVALSYDRLARWSLQDSMLEHWLHTEVAEFLYSAGLVAFVIIYLRSTDRAGTPGQS